MCCMYSKVCNAAAKSQQYFNSPGVAASTAAARLRPSFEGGQQMPNVGSCLVRVQERRLVR